MRISENWTCTPAWFINAAESTTCIANTVFAFSVDGFTSLVTLACMEARTWRWDDALTIRKDETFFALTTGFTFKILACCGIKNMHIIALLLTSILAIGPFHTSWTYLFSRIKNKFFQHRYNICYWFQFGWLKIKWIYAVFPISITLISHRLKYHYLSYLLLGNLMFYPCLIINTCLLIILAIPVSIFTSARQATFSFLASSWNNLTIRCTAAFLLLDTACTISIENISIRTVATFNTDRFGSNVGNIVTNSGTRVITTWWALVPNCIAWAFWKALTVLWPI